MARCVRWTSAAWLILSASTALGQQPKETTTHAPIVQPGAPGKRSKTVSPTAAGPTARKPAVADVRFMQGMIHHHAQAVEMVDLLRTRGESRELQAFGDRIAISQ